MRTFRSGSWEGEGEGGFDQSTYLTFTCEGVALPWPVVPPPMEMVAVYVDAPVGSVTKLNNATFVGAPFSYTA